MKRSPLHIVESPPVKAKLDRSPHVAPGLKLVHRETSALRFDAKGNPLEQRRRNLFMGTLASYHDWDLPDEGMPWWGWGLIGLVIAGCFVFGAQVFG